MRKYVVGFLFWKDWVLLLIKNKPDWQAGKLNGIGGKVEPGENFLAAMVREWNEETLGEMSVFSEPWREFAIERGMDGDGEAWETRFYSQDVSDLAERPRAPKQNDAGETMGWIQPECVGTHLPCIDNLLWLIPLARDPRCPIVLSRLLLSRSSS